MKILLKSPQDKSLTGPLQKFFLSIEDELKKNVGDAPDPGIDWENLRVFGDDRSRAASVFFEWEVPERPRGVIRYRVSISEKENFKVDAVIIITKTEKAEVFHLYTGKKYFWKVEMFRFGKLVSASPVFSFTTSNSMPRWINVPGATNFRDAGGWRLESGVRTRQGMLYRSSELNCHLHLTRRGRKVILNQLKIKTEIDFRKKPAKPSFKKNLVDWVNVPLSAYSGIFSDEQKESFKKIFEVLADAGNYPALFHCWGGTDRAGTAAFILNAVLGVKFEDIIKDYELSSMSIWGPRSSSSEEFKKFLEKLSSFGPPDNLKLCARNFLLSAGVDEKKIESFRKILSE